MCAQELSDAEIEHFLTHGYIVVDACFHREAVREWTDRAFARLECLRDDAMTWKVESIHMPSMIEVEISEFAPKLWRAICDLVGGKEKLQTALMWDSFIIKFNEGTSRPWEGPSSATRGWHKDGDHFRHFLDSPEQGLQVLAIWTDIYPRGGGTFVACDSISVVARFLAEHPEGLLPEEFNFRKLIGKCHKFVELTPKAGQAVLIHPFVLHSASQNHLGTPRIITNTPIKLREPMVFDRQNEDDFSAVESAILRGLGTQKYSFRPEGERETFVPARMRQQETMRAEEKARAARYRRRLDWS